MNHGDAASSTHPHDQHQPKEGLGHKIASAIKSKLPDSLTGHHDEPSSHRKTGTAHAMDDPLPATTHTPGHHPATTTDRGLDQSSAYTSGNQRDHDEPGLTDKIKSKMPGHHESGHHESGHHESGHHESGHHESGHHESGLTGSHHQASTGVYPDGDPLKGTHTAVHPSTTSTDRGDAYGSHGDQGPSVVDNIKSKLPGHDDHSGSHHKSDSLMRDNDPMSAHYTGPSHGKDHGSKHSTGGKYEHGQHQDPSFMDKIKDKLPDSMTGRHDKSDTGGYNTRGNANTQSQQNAGFNKNVDRDDLFADSTTTRQQQQQRGHTSATSGN